MKTQIKNMNHLKPHIAIILLTILIVVFGFITNSSLIGGLFGASYGLLSDPVIILAGVIIGLFRGYKNFLLVGAIVSVIAIAIIQYQVSEWHATLGVTRSMTELMYINAIRFFDIIFIAHLVNIPVVVLARRRSQKKY